MNNAPITVERTAPLLIITINRPEHRNAVDGLTAAVLVEALQSFEDDPKLSVAILTGAGDHFCAGADLKAVASNDPERSHHLSPEGAGPMGPTRMILSKPVIAAVSGYCVAGGLELALWCDLRVADETAIFGVFCRRFGVPLIDGGTVRLPRAIGMSRAMDMILTGRPVDAAEALQIGLANRVVKKDALLAEAKQLGLQIAAFPQICLRGDKRSAYEQWGMNEPSAIQNEFRHGMATLQSGETLAGAKNFISGIGRHGDFK